MIGSLRDSFRDDEQDLLPGLVGFQLHAGSLTVRGLSMDLFENVAFVGTQMGLIIQHSIVVALEVTDYNQPGEA